MSKNQNLKKQKRIEMVEKYKKLGYNYVVHTIRLKSSSVKFYKTYLAAKRYMHRQLKNPKNILSTVFTIREFKVVFF